MPEPATKDDILRRGEGGRNSEIGASVQESYGRLIALLENHLKYMDLQDARFNNRHPVPKKDPWTAEIDARIDKVESALEEKDRQIDAISERVRRLEERG